MNGVAEIVMMMLTRYNGRQGRSESLVDAERTALLVACANVLDHLDREGEWLQVR